MSAAAHQVVPGPGAIVFFGPPDVGQLGVIQSLIAVGGDALAPRMLSYTSWEVCTASFLSELQQAQGGLSLAVLSLWSGCHDLDTLGEQVCAPFLGVLEAAKVPLVVLTVGADEDHPPDKWWRQKQQYLASRGCTPAQVVCEVHPTRVLAAIQAHALPVGVSLAPFAAQFERALEERAKRKWTRAKECHDEDEIKIDHLA